jgi:hypothetical protein
MHCKGKKEGEKGELERHRCSLSVPHLTSCASDPPTGLRLPLKCMSFLPLKAVVRLILCKRLVKDHCEPHTRLVKPAARDRQVRVEVCIRQFLTRLQALAGLGHLVGLPGG